YVQRVPVAGALFLDIAGRDLGPADVARIQTFVDREFPPDRPTRRAAPRLAALLSPARVIADLSCAGLDDLIELAAARLAADAPAARSLAARIDERERDASSALGSGVIVPHAQLRGAATAAVLVSLARPLRLPTPDGVPVAVAVVLVSGEPPREHLELLARIARLARRGLAAELKGLRSPDRLLARLTALDS
ncbi:MAG TPA: PTS sugar transporter subunit IIA, partial [Kofleriaceae bacterium]|nr:PTS sugar transporter subunit IIA [Kofleriaceae bacterium]